MRKVLGTRSEEQISSEHVCSSCPTRGPKWVEESKENVVSWTTVVTPTKRPAAAAAKSASVHVFHASVERRRGVSECPVLPETVWIRRCCSRRWWRRRTTQHEVNDIYTCFPPGPLTRSAITTAVESARAPGPSLSPSPSPRRDASTRPLRESNRSPVPVIVTPQKSPRPSPSSRQDDSGLEKLQDENKVLKDQLATQACMPQRSPQIGGPRLIIISTQNKHTVRAGPGAVSRETGATHRDEYRTSHTRRPTSI